MTTRKLEGKCLCGTVQVSATLPEPHVEACHCTMCRTWGGGAYLSTHRAEAFEIAGEAHVTRYRSSKWAERGFCTRCGTHLFFHYLPLDTTSFSAGLFEGANRFDMTEEIFIDEKPGYYDFAGNRPRLTGAETIEKYSPTDH